MDSSKIKDIFSLRLKQMREERGLSQDEVGQLSNLSKATVSKYESANHPPKLLHAIAIAEALNVSFSYLVGFTDNRYVAETNAITDMYLQLSDDHKQELYKFAKYLMHKEAVEGEGVS